MITALIQRMIFILTMMLMPMMKMLIQSKNCVLILLTMIKKLIQGITFMLILLPMMTMLIQSKKNC